MRRLIREPLPVGWVLSLTPAAAEGGGCFVSRQEGASSVGHGVPDPDRSRREAARRARGRLRRYCAANRLNRLVTLTYAPPFCTDPLRVRGDAGVFVRNLREGLGGKPLPYAWVPEFHGDGERFHLHLAVGRYIKRSLIEDAWGHGWVHIKLLGDLPVGSGRLEEARRAAGYLSKYVAKSFTDDRIPGRHRYDVGQGFQPMQMQVWGRSRIDVLRQASDLLGKRSPDRVWSSDEHEGWKGPPAVWAQWS
jgi:hypothetical protein